MQAIAHEKPFTITLPLFIRPPAKIWCQDRTTPDQPRSLKSECSACKLHSKLCPANHSSETTIPSQREGLWQELFWIPRPKRPEVCKRWSAWLVCRKVRDVPFLLYSHAKWYMCTVHSHNVCYSIVLSESSIFGMISIPSRNCDSTRNRFQFSLAIRLL